MRDIKIAHFIHDEKFPDAAYKLFEEVAPDCSDYYIASRSQKLKYIKNIPIKFINRFSFKSKRFIKKLENEYDFVMLHALTAFNIQLVAHAASSKIKFVWIGMGYDYYDLIYENEEDLLLQDTQKIFHELRGEQNDTKLLQKIKDLAKKAIYKNITKEEVISRIDYFSPVLSNEYEMVKTKLQEKGIKKFPDYVYWNYGVSAHTLDDNNAPTVNQDQKGILLGNSASFTNNHMEMLDFLKENSSRFSQIVCPMSYGNVTYGKHIEQIGKSFFDEKFISIRQFMPYEEYVEKISKTSIVIMNHKRQQAAGNVIVMLLKGATVFLREENPLFKHYKDMDVVLFSIQDLKKNPELFERRLTNEEIINNRKQLKAFGGTEAALNKTRNLIKKVVEL